MNDINKALIKKWGRFIGLLLLLISVLLTGGYWFLKGYFRSQGPLSHPVSIIIESGTSLSQIAESLAQHKIIKCPNAFKLILKVVGLGSHLQAGEYVFQPHMSPFEVADMMAKGKGRLHKITIPEGLTSYQIFNVLKRHKALKADTDVLPLEGSLMPETYIFKRGTPFSLLIAQMQYKMSTLLQQLWEQREEGLPFKDPKEAVILASIVEKETGIPEERPRVAAVFVNRLKKKMHLQADPTTVYGLSQGKGALDRPLTRADLQSQIPHNTYVNRGLPPTPIAMPSRASLEAVLHPAKTKDLYFVADGKGGHAFAAHLKEHEKNVLNLRVIQKQAREEALLKKALEESEFQHAQSSSPQDSPSQEPSLIEQASQELSQNLESSNS
jgi:UPF0755 protein